MPTLEEDLTAAIALVSADSAVMNQIVNGDANTVVATTGGNVPSAAKVIADMLAGMAAAIGATALSWAYDVAVVMADPGAGKLRFDNVDLTLATEIAFAANSADSGGPDVSPYVAGWGDSDNPTKGHLIFRKSSDPSVFAIYTIASVVTDAGSWLSMNVTYVAGAGVFADTDVVYVQTLKSGSKGADGMGTGDLLAANNLSDIASAPTARANLAVPGLADKNVFTKPQVFGKGVDIPVLAALVLGNDGNSFNITGNGAITSIATVGVGAVVILKFPGTVTLTHHATDLIIQGGGSLITTPGTFAVLREYAVGKWELINYQDGSTAPGGGGGGSAVLKDEAIAAGATLIVNEFDNATYSRYQLELLDYEPNVDDRSLQMQTSDDVGVSWDVGTSDYRFQTDGFEHTQGATQWGVNPAGSYIAIQSFGARIGFAAGEKASTIFDIVQGGTGIATFFEWEQFYITDTGFNATGSGSGWRDNTTPVNAIKLYWTFSDSFQAKGRVKLRGFV